MKLAIVLAAVLTTTGCVHQVVRPDIDVPVSCIRKATMLRCDPRTEPPHCERIALAYAPGCERVMVTKR